jgi:PAS domain S-box-containing protein
MRYQDRTREQLIEELAVSQNRIADLDSRLALLSQLMGEDPSQRDESARLAETIVRLQEEINRCRQEERALRLSEEKYRSLVENMNDVIFSLDIQGGFTYISPAIERLTGYAANEVIGQPFARFVHPDDLEGLRDRFGQTLSGNLAPYEFRVLGRNGNQLYVRTSSRPLFEDGQVVGVAGVMADITKRKQAEEALWESESRLRTIMDVIPDPLAVYDSKGSVTYINAAFERTYGWSRKELLGKRIDFVPTDEEENTREAWERTMLGERFLFKTKRYTKQRKLLDVELTTTALFDQQGKHRDSIVIHRDVSERVRAEEALREANAELESFSYSVSHDLRAPLRGIDGWSLALIEDCADQLDDRGRKYLELVRTETQRMGKLIDDLLELSRVTRAAIRREKVNLSNLARSVVSRLQASEPDRNAEFAIQPDLKAYGDARLLEIMLSNLIGNAWKFTSKHASARIQFGRTDIVGQSVYFVQDDGAGFDMAYTKRLFGAFQRLHKTSEFPGSGVGLATVQRIVHRHGGRVWAKAEIEKGATFYFTL